jgi:hypothetical protein
MRGKRLAAGALCAAASFCAGTAAAGAATDTSLPAVPTFQVGAQLTSGARLAPGLFFIDPHQTVDSYLTGPEIVDSQGRVVWYDPLPQGESASNFQVQRFHGRPVLTWWQGTGDNPAFGAFAPGIGQGEDVVMNEHYQIIRSIPTTSDFTPDTHEFQLTPQGDALISGYQVVPGVDLSAVGGSSDGTVIDSLAREVNLDTGKVLFTWSALAHVPITNSYALPLFGTSPWDFFHINSISLAPDGNILISGRHTWALYDVDPRTGNIVWTLGGKNSNFAVLGNAQFAWQHDSRFISDDEIQLFDDQAGVPFRPAAAQSRALWLRLDYRDDTVSLVKQIIQPSGQAETSSQGSVQTLRDGHVVVGWGSTGTFGEYDSSGNLLANYTPAPTQPVGTVTVNGQVLPNTWSTYRVFKQDWSGAPVGAPAVSAMAAAGGQVNVSAAWNGATEVAAWEVLAGADPERLRPVGTVAWNGLVTTASVSAPAAGYVQVIALDDHPRPIGASAVSPVAAAGSSSSS